MTAMELTALLADLQQAGAWFIDTRDRSALLEAARQLEFRIHKIDLHDVHDKPQALQRIADVLSFPDTFGHNWDALADALNDLSWLDPGPRLLLFEHGNHWRDEQPDQFETLIDIAQHAAESWAEDGIAMWSFVSLPSIELGWMAGEG